MSTHVRHNRRKTLIGFVSSKMGDKSVKVTVTGLAPGEKVTVKVRNSRKSGTADSAGKFVATLKPGAKTGRFTITAVGQFSNIRRGTTTVKVLAGVSSSTAAPAAPPSAVTAPILITRRPCPVSSGFEPITDPAPVSTSETVLVMFALSGGTPSARSAG